MCLEAMLNSFQVDRFVAIRKLKFQTVRLAPRIELPVCHWMKIFVVREFFEDESRGQQNRDRQRQLNLGRLRCLKLHQLEWLLVRSLDLIRQAV